MDYEKQIQKLARKEEKKLARALARAPVESSDEEPEVNAPEMRPQRVQPPGPPQVHFNKLAKKKLHETAEYPHVYDLQREVNNEDYSGSLLFPVLILMWRNRMMILYKRGK